MSLRQTFFDKMKECMKSGDKETLGFVRNVINTIRKKEIDEKIECDDSHVIKIIQSQAKQRKESIDQFEKGGRDDLAAAEKKELSFLESFLPKQMSEQELAQVVDAVFEKVKPSSPKDMGKVMKEVLAQTQGQADGKLVSALVKKKLEATS